MDKKHIPLRVWAVLILYAAFSLMGCQSQPGPIQIGKINVTKQEFELGLKQFSGTTKYHKHLYPGAITLMLTDGCQFVKVEAEATWLFNAIASLQSDQRIQPHLFQMWQLKRWQGRWVLECRIESGEHVLTKISNSDFPLDNIELWVLDGIALLPSEY